MRDADVARLVVGAVHRYGDRQVRMLRDSVEILTFRGVSVEAGQMQDDSAVEPDMSGSHGSALRLLKTIVHQVTLVGVEQRVLSGSVGGGMTAVKQEMIDEREARHSELRLLGERMAFHASVALGDIVYAPEHFQESRVIRGGSESAEETAQELLQLAGRQLRASLGEFRQRAQVEILRPWGARSQRRLVISYGHPACRIAREEAYPGNLVHAVVGFRQEGVLGLEEKASHGLSAFRERPGQLPDAFPEQFVPQSCAPAAGKERNVDQFGRPAVGIPVEDLSSGQCSLMPGEDSESLRI